MAVERYFIMGVSVERLQNMEMGNVAVEVNF